MVTVLFVLYLCNRVDVSGNTIKSSRTYLFV